MNTRNSRPFSSHEVLRNPVSSYIMPCNLSRGWKTCLLHQLRNVGLHTTLRFMLEPRLSVSKLTDLEHELDHTGLHKEHWGLSGMRRLRGFEAFSRAPVPVAVHISGLRSSCTSSRIIAWSSRGGFSANRCKILLNIAPWCHLLS